MANLEIGTPYEVSWPSQRKDEKGYYGNFLRVELVSQNEKQNSSIVRITYLLGTTGSSDKWIRNNTSTQPTIQLGYNPNNTTYILNDPVGIKYFKGTGSYTDINKATQLAQWTVTVNHLTDGSGSFKAEYIWVTRDNEGYFPKNSDNQTENLVLPQINAPTTITVSPAILESGVATITGKAFNATNLSTIQWKLSDSSTWTNLGQTWVPADPTTLTITRTLAYNDLKALIGTKTTATVNLRCRTRLADGTTPVGGFTYANFTVQTGVIPMSWYDDMNGNVGVTLGKKATGPGFVIADAINPWDCEVNGKPWVNFVTEEHRETAEVEVAGGTTRRAMDSNCWRVWYDGTIEMWGAVEVNGGSSQTITFPYTLDACPTVQVSLTGSGSVEAQPFVWNITTTSMDLYLRRSGSFDTIMYYARGKVA